MILEKGGFTLDSYSDPNAALSHFMPDYYDLAVLDYLMPDLNGLELYKLLKDIDPSIKGLFLTASHEEIDQNQLQEHLNFVGKPILAAKLLNEVDSILNQVSIAKIEQ